jgi:hypothetical protein
MEQMHAQPGIDCLLVSPSLDAALQALAGQN